MRDFLIDTDTASDDAVALIMALRAPDVRVRAITIVAGNVAVEQASRNALYVAELCGSDVPVYRGASRPLYREHAHAGGFMAKTAWAITAIRRPRVRWRRGHAMDAIIDVVRGHPGIVLVTLGPLTNVALALSKAPEIAAQVSRCVVMGGNPCCEGNVTPAAEYNIWVDPEAARIVLHSGIPVELAGWHLCRGQAVLGARDIEHVLSLGTPLARFAVECNSRAMEAYRIQTGESGIALPDPTAMCIALDPTVCTSISSHLVEIEVSSELTRGMTVVDRLGVATDERNRAVWSGARETKVVWSIDNAHWKRTLYAALQPR